MLRRRRQPRRLKSQAVLSLIDFARSRGTKIVWTVHNLASHERRYPRLEKWFWRAFLRRLDGFITLSESGLSKRARKIYRVA